MKKRVIIVLIIVLILFIIFYPYIKAEYLTVKFGDNFSEGYKEVEWIESIEYYRVIDINETTATVVYIYSNHKACFKCNFDFVDGKWACTSWDCVWTKLGGNADGFMWPYYP